jgi:hypothetical protein
VTGARWRPGRAGLAGAGDQAGTGAPRTRSPGRPPSTDRARPERRRPGLARRERAGAARCRWGQDAPGCGAAARYRWDRGEPGCAGAVLCPWGRGRRGCAATGRCSPDAGRPGCAGGGRWRLGGRGRRRRAARSRTGHATAGGAEDPMGLGRRQPRGGRSIPLSPVPCRRKDGFPEKALQAGPKPETVCRCADGTGRNRTGQGLSARRNRVPRMRARRDSGHSSTTERLNCLLLQALARMTPGSLDRQS